MRTSYFVLIVLCISFTFALPFTFFQYINFQYHINHNAELQYVIDHTVNPVDQSTTTNYGYRKSPWETVAETSSSLFFFVPGILTIILSALLFSHSKLSPVRRYFHATLLTLILIPISLLAHLPWAWIYSGANLYDDVTGFTVLFVFFSGFVVAFCSAIINGILWIRLKNHS